MAAPLYPPKRSDWTPTPEFEAKVEATNKLITPILDALEHGEEPPADWQKTLFGTEVGAGRDWSLSKALGAKMADEIEKIGSLGVRFPRTLKDSVHLKYESGPVLFCLTLRHKFQTPRTEEIYAEWDKRDCFVTFARIALYRGQRKAARAVLQVALEVVIAEQQQAQKDASPESWVIAREHAAEFFPDMASQSTS